MDEQKYPFHKKDNIGRIVYSKWSNSERSVKKYWGSTNKIKILYKFQGDEVSIDAFDLNGKKVFFYYYGRFFIDLDKLKIDKSFVFFNIKKSIIDKIKNLLNEKF